MSPTGSSAVEVKICGLRTPEHLSWVRQSGAALAGLVFATSRRQVTVAEAQAITLSARQDAGQHRRASITTPLLVGVFAEQTVEEVAAMAATCRLDIVQLSGRESAQVTASLARQGLRVVKAVHVDEEMSAQQIVALMAPHAEAGAEAILLDTASKQGGGSGRAFDWRVAREVVELTSIPVMLAGGLTPDNVATAIEMVRPWGVDVSSGVETDGAKDRLKIEAFVRAATDTARVGR